VNFADLPSERRAAAQVAAVVELFADSSIAGATFTVVSGPSYVGDVITQQTPCSVWDYGDVGIWLRGLTPGAAVTLRASAAGYVSVERTVFAQTSGYSEIFSFR
jgi:hypothetical protein